MQNTLGHGSQAQLIADAKVMGDRLLVLSCSMEELEIPFQSIPALNRIPMGERASFEIADDGAYIYWAGADIHLDLDTFRCYTDPAWHQKFAAFKLTHDQLFGKAIATLRKNHKLRQTDITGLSDRQVRRIELGESSTKIDTLKLLAASHGMELDTYLDAVASLIGEIPAELTC